MKRWGIYISLFVLMASVFSCTDERLVNDTGGKIKVTGTVDTPSRTSYTVGETAVSVTWAMNDEIGLLTGKQPETLRYKAVSEGKQTDFQPVNNSLEGEAGDDVYAYYPYHSYYSPQVSYPYVPLPYLFGQSYQDGLPDPNLDFMYAKGQIQGGAVNLHFSHLFAYLKLNIRTELLQNARGLFINTHEPIAYSSPEDQIASYNLEDGTISVKEYYNYLWYYFQPEDIADKEIITCYIAVLPTSEDNIVTVSIHDQDGNIGNNLIERKAPKGGFQAGHVYNLSINENEFDKIEQQEREALIALYNATGGSSWKDNANWCSDKPLSEWAGVSVWDGRVKYISLVDNGLVGELPEELGNLTALENLYLGYNQLSGSLPESMGNLTQLRYLSLPYNNLTGTIPESFVAWMDALEYIDLSGNGFTGRLPEAIVTHPRWKDLWSGWIKGGFDMSGVKLPAPDFTVTDIYGNQISSVEEYANNKLTAVLHWWSSCPWSDMYMKQQLIPWYTMYHEKGFEIIGYSTEEMGTLRNYVETYEIPWKNFQYTGENTIPQLYSSSTPTIFLIDQNKEVIFQSITQNRDDLVQVLADRLGKVELYTSTDYSRDGEVVQLQYATQGKGINLVFMGEAFVDKDMEPGGLYEQKMKEAMEQYFAYEPLRSFRNRFNVYAVKVVSPNAEFVEGAEHRINEDANICFKYAKKVAGLETAPYQMVSVIYNKGCSGRSYTIMYSDKSYVGFMMEGVNDVLNHEVCGHGLGKLKDEYVEYGYENQTLPQSERNEMDNDWNNWKWGANVDWRNDAATVKWARFLSDARYAGEALGLYEGAYLYGYGAYRPTENSMMRYNDSPFNAPSRERIYQVIMELSEGSSWTYDYEEFVSIDAVSRNYAASRALRTSPSAETRESWRKRHRAPVWVNGSWKDAKNTRQILVPLK